jgi:prepilin-type processing-associated H-X9-DG protein
VGLTEGSAFGAWQITSPAPPFAGSYGYNGWLVNTRFNSRFPGTGLGADTFTIRAKDTLPLLLDSASVWGFPDPQARPPRYEDQLSGPMGPFCVNRHGGRTNGLFLDWSVRAIGLKELWTLKWYPSFDTAGRWTLAGGVKPEDWPKWMRKFKDY